MEQEIAALLGVIEDPKSVPGGASKDGDDSTIQNFTGDLKVHLLKELIPKMIYNLSDPPEYEKAKLQFRNFMGDFGYPEDLQEIVTLIESTPTHDANALKKLELLVAKVEALQKEDYEKLEDIRNQLSKLP